MTIALGTTDIMLGILSVLQVVALFVQWRLDKTHQGPGWWVLGSTILALAFATAYLRQIPALTTFGVIANTLLFGYAVVPLYIGILRFLGRRERRRLLSALLIVYTLVVFYFVFLNDSVSARREAIYLATAGMTLLSARALIRYQFRSISATANLLAAGFIFQCLVSIVAFVVAVSNPQPVALLAATPDQQIVFMVSVFITTLWTFGFILMVNQRLSAENREAAENRERIFNTSPDAESITRLADGLIVEVNDGFTVLTGYTRAEVLGKTAADINLYQNPADHAKLVNLLNTQESFENIEFEFRRKDGTCRVGMMSARTIVLQDSPHIISVTRDISDRKQAEEALRLSEQKFKSMTETSPLAIYMSLGTEQIAEYVNPTFVRLFGYQLEDVPTAAHWYPLAYPDEHYRNQLIDEWQRRVEHAIETRSAIEPMETVVTCKDGSRKYISWGYVSSGVQNWAFGLDLTERKRVEEVLRLAEARYARAVRGTSDGIWDRNLQTGEVYRSPRYKELLGYADDELQNSQAAFEALLHPDDLPMMRAAAQAHLERREPYDIELRLRTKDGEYRWFHSRGQADWDAAGHATFMAGSIMDITDRKRAEDALRELNATLEQRVADRTAELRATNLRLTELDHLKDEFLSRISHELRTPLTSVKLYVELLETGKPEKRDQYLQTLKHEADRLHALIEEVLMFSQLNLNTEPSALLPVNLNDLVEGSLTTWQELNADHDLVLRRDLARDLPRVRTDGDLIRLALTRLIANAVNYTSAGSVSVSTTRREAAGQTWVTISVTDTGPGITPQDLPHIFERFYRGRAAADYKTPGTGIGLSISREIVEKLGGRLTVESEVGVGSTFTVWLPIDR